MLDETLKHARQKTVGVKQTLRAIEKGSVKCIFIAEDAEAHVTRPIIELCRDQKVRIVRVPTMLELGKACSIQVGAAVGAILSE
ncbi:MAG: ribosomal L7Ae/L30e/S12e/Gadd45 family protein [Desulfitobacteriaceae bacterium]|nr:ribosomal L7Ae/L30e/S12e/Gadd45 family protein [Desulfitobacteriaceae bacterium]MDD4346050.1 ribosomal L7Ae/L30e/S12e/Gadd45 family protein [Desulfitobacteriaceae bacterium]MDD4401436.1 ribosomal L7Ae/L30e/S12e/Gadd45 family protein [Desulfitobacteriaceae bacterium]